MRKVKGYCIATSYGSLYSGWHQRRKDMIYQHTTEKGTTWKECMKNGDHVVPVIIRW